MSAPNALPLAKRLLAAGVPVVVVRAGEQYPKGSRSGLVASDCDLSAYRPGVDALAMVTGYGIDAVDVDVKDGKDGSLDNLPPFPSFGQTLSPSGGTHDIVPTSGLGTKIDLSTERGFVGDYLGKHSLVFLPGSVRTKPSHGGKAYKRATKWDVEGCLAAQPDAGLVAALQASGARSSARERHYDDSPERPETDGVHPYAATAIAQELARLEDCANDRWLGEPWDKTTFAVACNLIEFANSGWTGYTLEQAEADLFAHAPTDPGFGPAKHRAKWESALRSVEGGGRPNPDSSPADDFGAIEGEEPEAHEVRPASSWQEINLGQVLDGLLAGTLTRPEPTVGRISGGSALFYPGRINGVHGDSSAGKTWTALAACRDVIEDGGVAVYIDFEDDAAGVLARIIEMGVKPDAIRSGQFRYLHPEEGLTRRKAGSVETKPEMALLVGQIKEWQPALVVIDSTGEALAIEGAKPNDDDDVARWFQLLPRRLAALGPAVVLLDHMTKGKDNDGLWPIGSQRKRAAITGAQYLQEVRKPFAKDTPGYSVLKCAKDRNGHYRQGQAVAMLRVDADQPGLISVRAVEDVAVDPEMAAASKQEATWDRIRDVLDQMGECSTSAIYKSLALSEHTIVPVLRDRLATGEVVMRPKGQSKLWSLPAGEPS